jgi:hypothetical protein
MAKFDFVKNLGLIVTLSAIFGVATLIYTSNNDNMKTPFGNNKKPESNFEASVVIQGGDAQENTIKVNDVLTAIVSVNQANNLKDFTLSWIDVDSKDALTEEKLLDGKCAIFEDNNDISEECQLNYQIQGGDVNKTIQAKVTFYEKDQIISTIMSNQTRKVIESPVDMSNIGGVVNFTLIFLLLLIVVILPYVYKNNLNNPLTIPGIILVLAILGLAVFGVISLNNLIPTLAIVVMIGLNFYSTSTTK